MQKRKNTKAAFKRSVKKLFFLFSLLFFGVYHTDIVYHTYHTDMHTCSQNYIHCVCNFDYTCVYDTHKYILYMKLFVQYNV
jgi:hypothetical protein